MRLSKFQTRIGAYAAAAGALAAGTLSADPNQTPADTATSSKSDERLEPGAGVPENALVVLDEIDLVDCRYGPPSASIPPDLQGDYEDCTPQPEPGRSWATYNYGIITGSWYISKDATRRIDRWLDEHQSSAPAGLAAGGAATCGGIGLTTAGVGAAVCGIMAAKAGFHFADFQDSVNNAVARNGCLKLSGDNFSATSSDNKYCASLD